MTRSICTIRAEVANNDVGGEDPEAAGVCGDVTQEQRAGGGSQIAASSPPAVRYRGGTGQDCDVNEPSIRSALANRCSYYFELREIMRAHASTRPQLLNTDAAVRLDDTEDDERSSSDNETKSS
ncbi:hypothetical protein ON010_g4636 [Phytophthora cinnamomi]|nr:hypothetical protein ON010_g4636 [Phytophthora cinnamomi]